MHKKPCEIFTVILQYARWAFKLQILQAMAGGVRILFLVIVKGRVEPPQIACGDHFKYHVQGRVLRAEGPAAKSRS